MHAQYRSNRDRILRACLNRELGRLSVDACACVTSRVHVLGRVRTNDTITNFLDAYSDWLSGTSPWLDQSSPKPGLARWMVAFHMSVVRPLVGHCPNTGQ